MERKVSLIALCKARMANKNSQRHARSPVVSQSGRKKEHAKIEAKISVVAQRIKTRSAATRTSKRSGGKKSNNIVDE